MASRTLVSDVGVDPPILPHTQEAGDPYYIGDIYNQSPPAVSQEWETDLKSPYLAYIKSVATSWPHLRYLADFMEVSTTPLRWKFLRHNMAERRERSNRTNVACLDFLHSGDAIRTDFKTGEDLETALGEGGVKNDCDNVHLRLFVVEDLSRRVIETLGAKFDLDPTFFREHIDDYSWYNTRDRWMDPPVLDIDRKQQSWFQLRFIRPRYFRTRESFERARAESNKFNVLRRPDDDQNNKAIFDAKGAIVGISRTRVSFWFRRNNDKQNGVVGILLLDPTISEGFQLWQGHRNWDSIPSMHSSTLPKGPPRTSLFEDVVYWTLKSGQLTKSPTTNLKQTPQVLIQPLLRLICADWLTMSNYIKTRLGQIEWELGFPKLFLINGEIIDTALRKLHIWRRLVPLYREMLSETLERVFDFPYYSSTFNNESRSQENGNSYLSHACGCRATQNNPSFQLQTSYDLRPDFERALAQMQEYQLRVDRLTSVVTAAMSIDDSRRGLQENRNVARLTWLATIFIPLSFITGFFSMQPNIGDLNYTFVWFLATAVPILVITLFFARKLSIGLFMKQGARVKRVNVEKSN